MDAEGRIPMTAPLEVLRDAIDRCARGRQSNVMLSLDDAVPILAAIEEQEAAMRAAADAMNKAMEAQ